MFLVPLCVLAISTVYPSLKETLQGGTSLTLPAGVIHPSSCSLGASFFFVEKKDKSLTCIDFHGLNNMTIKNEYLLLLLFSAFELIQGAIIFSKLDLCNIYNLRLWKESGK